MLCGEHRDSTGNGRYTPVDSTFAFTAINTQIGGGCSKRPVLRIGQQGFQSASGVDSAHLCTIQP